MATYRLTHRLKSSKLVSENFRGTDGTGKPVVVKQLTGADPSTHSRLLSVCSLWGNLPDTMTPVVREWGKVRGFSVVCQAVDAESLRTLMSAATAAGVRPTPHELVSLIYEIAAQLHDLHERGSDAVHGDLCASTVLIDPWGVLMLDDLGLARALGKTPAGPARFEPVTLAPEQLNDVNTSATDIFRLGLILYELMMMRPLFNVASMAQLEPAVRSYTQIPPLGINHPMLPLLTSMLALNPAERPTAAKVQQVLTGLAQQAKLRVGPESLQEFFTRVLPTRPQLEPLSSPVDFSTAVTGENAAPAPVTGAALGKISTTKMTAADLQAAREAEAAAAAAAAAALLPPPPELTIDQKIAQQLVSTGKITEAQSKSALEVVEALGGTIAEALLSDGVLPDDEILLAEAAVTQTNPITGDKLLALQPNPDLLARLPEAEADELLVVPIAIKPPANILVAMRNPGDAALIERLTRTMSATSVTGLRGSANAIRRTIGRFYRGVDEGDANDWLDRGPSSIAARGAPPAELELEQDVAVSAAAAIAAPPLPMAPGDEIFPIVDALLTALGAGGIEVRRSVDWAVRVGRRMSLNTQSLQQLRLAFTAGLLCNLLERRKLLDPPKENSLRALCQTAWPKVGPVVREWCDESPAGDGLPAIIHGLRSLAAESGTLSNHGVSPSSWTNLATRLRVSLEVMRAIGTELARE